MKTKKITKITKNTELSTVYDFTVEDAHHYILDNDVVSHNSYVPTKAVSGGGGLIYACSSILMIGKKKDKDGNDVVGNILKVETHKSRFSKVNQKIELKLSFTTGLDKYYGLLPLAEKYGIFKKVSTRYEMPDGSKQFEKAIYNNPEKWFTKEVLDRLDEAARKEYALGEGDVPEEDEESTTSEETAKDNE